MNSELFNRACRVIPGGVNSPVRAFGSVGGTPRFISRGEGAYLYDADGRSYVDYICSWGPLIHGHGNTAISDSILSALQAGTSFGAPTESEILFAELLCEIVPGLERVRMVNSGTEATMSAVRLARGYTGRDYVMKFNGCYHGHADLFLVQAGSGVATQGIAGSPGVPASTVQTTLSIPYNNIDALERSLDEIGPEKFAAIIVEPVAGNMGLVVPDLGYLQSLRAICDRHGIVLIFDEVMSGFRVALGGAAEKFSITPDLLTLGKVIGGGLPVGAFGGRKDIMNQLAPVGPVYQAGTLSGNPLAMAAGLASVRLLVSTNPYEQLEAKAKELTNGLALIAKKYSIPLQTAFCGSMFGFFFADNPVNNFEDSKASNQKIFASFFHGMLERGVYLAPSPFEAGFLSTAHGPLEIQKTLAAAEDVMSSLG